MTASGSDAAGGPADGQSPARRDGRSEHLVGRFRSWSTMHRCSRGFLLSPPLRSSRGDLGTGPCPLHAVACGGSGRSYLRHLLQPWASATRNRRAVVGALRGYVRRDEAGHEQLRRERLYRCVGSRLCERIRCGPATVGLRAGGDVAVGRRLRRAVIARAAPRAPRGACLAARPACDGASPGGIPLGFSRRPRGTPASRTVPPDAAPCLASARTSGRRRQASRRRPTHGPLFAISFSVPCSFLPLGLHSTFRCRS
jgi:hypothetical protein